jgi:hypothetical protein
MRCLAQVRRPRGLSICSTTRSRRTVLSRATTTRSSSMTEDLLEIVGAHRDEGFGGLGLGPAEPPGRGQPG